jgi:hypothetical protein
MTTSGTLIACHVIRSAQVEVGMPADLSGTGHWTAGKARPLTRGAYSPLGVRSALHIGDDQRANVAFCAPKPQRYPRTLAHRTGGVTSGVSQPLTAWAQPLLGLGGRRIFLEKRQ